MALNLRDIFKGVPSGTEKLGVVGWPLSHTLSPAMHNAAIRAVNQDAVYRKIEVPPAEWDEFLRQAKGFLHGFNVTLPHKEMISLDRGEGNSFSSLSSLMGAMNTVVRQGAGWAADNTDGPGFLDDLKALMISLAGKNVVLLGAGGSARGLLFAIDLLSLEVPARVTIVNRTPEKAQKLIGDFTRRASKPRFPVSSAAVDEKAAFQGADLIINATSVGLQPGAPPVPPAFLHKRLVVYDLIYHRETELMKASRAAGAAAHGGLGMLVRQGARSFGIWFNRPPPVDVMRKAAEDELKRRQTT